jgi:hypothetical protein
MDAIGGHDVKGSKSGSETQSLHVLSHVWKIYPKDEHIHKKNP